MEENLINDYNRCLSNTGEPTHRHYSYHSFSVPYISVYDSCLAFEFECLSDDELCGSVHFPVILKAPSIDGDPSAEHRKFGKADCLSIQYVCRSCLMDLSCPRIQWPSLLIF